MNKHKLVHLKFRFMKNRSLLTFIVVMIVLGTKAQVPNYVPLNGLQGYWPFTGNANDLSGNNYNGTVNGATLTTDRFNSQNCAYNFNGISDFISTNYAGILGANPRALSFWAKTSYTVGMHAVVWGGNAQATRYSGAISNGACFDGSFGYLTYTTTATNSCDNNWHHYVFQFNGTLINQVEVYLDAVLLNQVAASYNPTNVLNTVSTFSVHFGKAVYAPSPAYFKGQLDDVGIWDRKLTLCEIKQLYTGTYPLSFNITGNTSVCAGQSAVLTASGATNCNWSNLSAGNSITVTPVATTSYSVTGLISGCAAQNSVTVTVNPIPFLNLTSSGVICAGETATLSAIGASSYTWSPQQGVTSSIVVSPGVTTIYSVVAVGPGDCPAVPASITQSVAVCASLSEINNGHPAFKVFPNPADGIFYFVGSAAECKIEVYDLFGNVVYSTWSINNHTEIDLTQQCSGIYFLKVSDKNLTITGKIIRQ